ncbi:MAG TPA: TAT-variant-translocated molybdopterin oxidoreductase [Chitinophagaceae bacterium]|nr:TAT-variant-translocated molybdopterin oxidoreductase [Chitinophagaceae bacterium]
MEQNKHWQSFGELNNSDAFQESGKDEFKEELPFEGEEGGGFFKTPTPRRDFLKYLGFSTAAAAIAAGCEIPLKKTIPFANKPEDIVPGVADYYATTFLQDGDVLSILAKVRDGRPIKIEGNELSPLTEGGTSARAQASVLELYDSTRLRFPSKGGNELTYEAADRDIAAALAGLGGAPVVILTSTINSPTTLDVINQFIAKYPGSRHVQYDAVSYTGMLLANEATYGKRAIPSYRFDNAKVIVSIGADFLGTWLSPVEFARQYSKGRKIDQKNPQLSRHFHFETVATMTGGNADERYLHRPSETGAIAVALLNAVKGQAVSGVEDKVKEGVTKAAKELLASKGAALVVCGSNDVNIQTVVNAINEELQAGGNTIDWSATLNYKKGVDKDFADLVADMNAGKVGALLVYGANPAYSWYDADKVKSGLAKVGLTVSFSGKKDETAVLCKYILPDSHFLESWGDAEPKTGYYSFMQPTIHPLFKTRQWQDSLLKWSGAATDYLTYLKTYWAGKLGGEMGWDKALQDGVSTAAATAPGAAGAAFNAATVAAAISAAGSGKKGGKVEVVLYQKVAIGAGQGTGNPWLQEMPDPVTKATWDNYVIVSPKMAKSLLGIDVLIPGEADAYEVNPPKKLVKVTVNGKTVTLPSVIIPGTEPNTIGIALGYGRTPDIGMAALTDEGTPVGANVFPLASFDGNSVNFYGDADIVLGDGTFVVAMTQTHDVYTTPQGTRTEVMKELTLNSFKSKPMQVLEDREHELKPWGGLDNFERDGTIYPVYDKPGIHWGMNVDLNSCTGCGACVVACFAENNIPMVGKREVSRFHDMHWIRIDRYYSGDVDNPTVVYQPLMCQHCDNAPCENVCPVNATNHSTEGLNQMAYNRCIGTRYCANNCPYKVRRFNWADYTGADSFPHNQYGHLSTATWDMNAELPRMVLNPDVTVRSRGVMEKCSFCVQRLQEGKLKAKKESRPLKSGENNEWDVKTACQQACPTNAIVFGNKNDSKSAVTVARAENNERLFRVIEQLHTLPNVTYLAKVRNRDEELSIEE